MLLDLEKAVERYRTLGLAIEGAVEVDEWDEVDVLLNERDKVLTAFSSGALRIDEQSKSDLQACDRRLIQFLTGTQVQAIEGLRNIQEGTQLRRTYHPSSPANSFERAG